jgi:3-oxoacyl-[acyl-carrier-protein] synthase II
MIGGGAHSMIHPFGVTGFNRLTALDRQRRPAEGQPPVRRPPRRVRARARGPGVVVLETLEHAQKRGATILAEVVGYGSTADAYRITDQDPRGHGRGRRDARGAADAKLTPPTCSTSTPTAPAPGRTTGNETNAIRGVRRAGEAGARSAASRA